jgi:uncharacterized protein (TIGR03084 family)
LTAHGLYARGVCHDARMDELCDDLVAEHDDLDHLVAPLGPVDWSRDTPAPGWAIRDQISHLTYFDGTALQALTDLDAFRAGRDALIAGLPADPSVDLGRSVPPEELLAAWRTGRGALVAAARRLDPTARVEWYGPPMSARSFITARLMETWAHGQDVADTLGATRVPTDRLRHVAHIGVSTRAWSYTVHGREVPQGDVRVELDAPGGDCWSWGDQAAADVVRGPALDFCLVVTQRRHVDDTALVAQGQLAGEWLGLAQAFAGGAGEGRRPGEFTDRGSA